MAGTVLHLAAHPDDELLGAPAVLFALRDAGWRVVNLACGLGRPHQHARRRAEAEDAARRSGFDLVVADPPAALSSGDDLAGAERRLAGVVGTAVDDLGPAVVVSPSPHDGHHAHEAVARAARAALAGRSPPPRWWLWGIWAPLELPTAAVAFGEERMAEILAALGAYRGEIGRNDLRRLVRGRAELYAATVPELLFGFGTPAGGLSYVDAVCELVPGGGRWMLGSPRWLDPADPLGAGPTSRDVTGWVDEPSPRRRFVSDP